MTLTRPALPLVRVLPVLAIAAALAGAACAGADEPRPTPAEELSRAGFAVLESGGDSTLAEASVAYRSGELTVRAFVCFDPRAGEPRPLVLFNHGGVSGVSADMKRRSRELARDWGFVVIAPSYRGEDGSDGVVEVAAGEVDDVLAAAEVGARWPRVDGARVLLAGSSHGALISMLAAARAPERFIGVAAACGVMDVVSWYDYLVRNRFDVSDSLSVAVYGKGPADRPEAFLKRQAVAVADRIDVPVLLQQGQVDRIVPPEQARLMKATLEQGGNPDAFLLEYPLLGHAFWFWDDPARHSREEMAQAAEAWNDLVSFLRATADKPAGDR